MSIATAFVRTRAQACVVRLLLRIFEAGVMPGCAYANQTVYGLKARMLTKRSYYLSRWYKRSELTFRLGLWMTMAPLS